MAHKHPTDYFFDQRTSILKMPGILAQYEGSTIDYDDPNSPQERYSEIILSKIRDFDIPEHYMQEEIKRELQAFLEIALWINNKKCSDCAR